MGTFIFFIPVQSRWICKALSFCLSYLDLLARLLVEVLHKERDRSVAAVGEVKELFAAPLDQSDAVQLAHVRRARSLGGFINIKRQFHAKRETEL